MKKLRIILKKFLPNHLYSKIYGFYLILRHPRKEIPNYAIHPNNMITHIGGNKRIECPITNKKYGINSLKGKQIINTYHKHLLTKKENNCS